MSGQTFVLMPVKANNAQLLSQDRVNLRPTNQQSLGGGLPSEDHHGVKQNYSKRTSAYQDILYKYISWEDPVRTLSSYFGVLVLLLGAHYLPLTQIGLKIALTTLGVVSVSEFASRSFGPNSLSARLRPKEYMKVPESDLKVVLESIHDLVQYAAIQAQRIVFGEDLDKTFVAFLGLTVTYWLIKIMSPFGLAIVGLTSLYTTSFLASPQGRAITYDASKGAQDLASSATENGKRLAQNGNAKASELIDSATEGGKRLAQNGNVKANELSSKMQEAVSEAADQVQDLAQSGKQTASDMSARVNDTVSDFPRAVAEHTNKPSQAGMDVHENSANRYLPSSDSTQYVDNFFSDDTTGVPDKYQISMSEATIRMPHLSDGIAEETSYTTSSNNIIRKPISDYLVDSTPRPLGQVQGTSKQTGHTAGYNPIYE